jgi:hypothetical protein
VTLLDDFGKEVGANTMIKVREEPVSYHTKLRLKGWGRQHARYQANLEVDHITPMGYDTQVHLSVSLYQEPMPMVFGFVEEEAQIIVEVGLVPQEHWTREHLGRKGDRMMEEELSIGGIEYALYTYTYKDLDGT